VLPVRIPLSCRVSIVFLLCSSQIVGAAAPARPAAVSIFPLAPRWSIEIGGPPVAGAAPIADEHHLYVALRAGQIAAYDLSDGHERWRKPVTAAHPLVVESGMLFVATDKTIRALKVEDGTQVWEVPVTITAPLAAHAGWLIAITGGTINALRATDGAKVWERSLAPVTLRPAIEGDSLYLAVDDGRVVALQIKDGQLTWERLLGGVPQEPFATPERVYAGASDRHFYCLKTSTGEIDWQRRIGSELQGPAAADKSLVYIVALDNVVRAYARGNGNQRWQHPLKHRPATGPFVVGSAVLIGSQSTPEIWAWRPDGRSAGVIGTPAEPAVAPEFVDRGAEGAFVFVVTGGLTNQWKLTLLATAGDPPLQPLDGLPGELVELKLEIKN
jgi:outer membrane protein assembly factor BamB